MRKAKGGKEKKEERGEAGQQRGGKNTKEIACSTDRTESPSDSIADCLLMAVLHPIRINYRYSFPMPHAPGVSSGRGGKFDSRGNTIVLLHPICSASLFCFPLIIHANLTNYR